MEKLSEKILTLLALGQKAFDGLDVDALSLHSRFLFAIRYKSCSPSELIDTLSQHKSNLTHLANNVIADGLATKISETSDKRKISYAITDKGIEHIDNILKQAENKFTSFLDDESEYNDAKEKFDEIINILSYL